MSSEYQAGTAVTYEPGNPEELSSLKLSSMADAMELAMQRNKTIDDGDPDPYGYGQELEDQFGIDLLTPNWKAKPTDTRWAKRIKARARMASIAKLFLKGYSPADIAEKVAVSIVTVHKDLQHLSQEWRKSYLEDIETLAARDLTRLDYLLSQLADGIEAGDTKSINSAIEIVKTRAQILGYREGVQVDIEQYIMEVAEANGYDPKKAVQIAQRIRVSMK